MAVIPNINLSDSLNNNSSAQGGKISGGFTFNTAGGSFGLVKMLAIAAVALIGFKIWRGGK